MCAKQPCRSLCHSCRHSVCTVSSPDSYRCSRIYLDIDQYGKYIFVLLTNHIKKNETIRLSPNCVICPDRLFFHDVGVFSCVTTSLVICGLCFSYCVVFVCVGFLECMCRHVCGITVFVYGVCVKWVFVWSVCLFVWSVCVCMFMWLQVVENCCLISVILHNKKEKEEQKDGGGGGGEGWRRRRR